MLPADMRFSHKQKCNKLSSNPCYLSRASNECAKSFTATVTVSMPRWRCATARACEMCPSPSVAVPANAEFATCSYIARKFGLHSAMPGTCAKTCPDLVVVPTNMEKYRIESQRVQSIFYDYTPCGPLSLDEAFLDVSECLLHQGGATRCGNSRPRAGQWNHHFCRHRTKQVLAKISSD